VGPIVSDSALRAAGGLPGRHAFDHLDVFLVLWLVRLVSTSMPLEPESRLTIPRASHAAPAAPFANQSSISILSSSLWRLRSSSFCSAFDNTPPSIRRSSGLVPCRFQISLIRIRSFLGRLPRGLQCLLICGEDYVWSSEGQLPSDGSWSTAKRSLNSEPGIAGAASTGEAQI
jgi:hypothetical protein